jgi:hypothetical protein
MESRSAMAVFDDTKESGGAEKNWVTRPIRPNHVSKGSKPVTTPTLIITW